MYSYPKNKQVESASFQPAFLLTCKRLHSMFS